MVNVFSSDHKQATAGSGTLAVTSPMRLVIVNLMYVEIACCVYTTTVKRRKRYVGASALPASHRYSNAAVIRMNTTDAMKKKTFACRLLYATHNYFRYTKKK